MDRFVQMTCFARAVEMGSLSSAGRDLGISQPNMSRYVSALEEHLQTRLLHRSTRNLVLTPEGERYYAEVRRILDAVTESESSLRENVEPSGLLRVACPTALAHAFVMPQIPAFLARYSDVSLDLQISDQYVDLVGEGAELAIRIGHLQDSSLRARRVGLFQRVCVASKAYLEKRGTPVEPNDLRDHDCVIYSLLSSGNTWSFLNTDVSVTGRIRVNSPEAVRTAVLSGLGVGYGPQWLFEDGLKDESLCLILNEHFSPPVPIQILYVANRLMPKRVTAFMDFMTQAFSEISAINMNGVQPKNA